MIHLRSEQAKERNEPVTTYAPIARSLHTMDDVVRVQMKQKFDICDRICENRPPYKIRTLEIRAFECGRVVLDPNF